MNNSEINMYLDDIKEYVKSTLIYLNNNNNIDKEEIIMYLSSVNECIKNIKDILINYLYYLEDKIDISYANEVKKSIYKLISDLREVENNE